MTKMITMMLAVLMLALPLGTAMAEQTVEPLVGKIIDVREDGGLLIERLDDGSEVMVNVSDETKVEADWTLGVGDVVYVSYNGIMTRSLPPQVHAEVIRSHTVEGMVIEVDSDRNRVLIDSPQAGQVWFTLPEDVKADDYAEGVVRAYFNGIMALSLPAQAFADAIETLAVENGKVTEMADTYFLMDWNESGLRVNFDEQTKMMETFDVGDTVQVYYRGIMTRSLPPQVYAVTVVKTEQP